MAISLNVQDIDRYPGTVKTVSIDQNTVVPTGYAGDEQFVLMISTSAYSDIATKKKIQSVYITESNIGWAKSSGLAGVGGKFAIDSNHYKIKVKLDTTLSGSDGSGYYTISLAYDSNGMALAGETIAADMESKIRSIVCVTADTGLQLAYKNANVVFSEGKFKVSSGTIGRYYTGSFKSSVSIKPADDHDCSLVLGFNRPVTSENIATTTVGEALLMSDYTVGSSTLTVAAGSGVVAGQCIAIMDATNIDYCPVLNVSGTLLTVPNMANNSFNSIAHNYSVADGARIQILKDQDPDVLPNNWCTSIDSLVRYGVTSIVNLIDFSA